MTVAGAPGFVLGQRVVSQEYGEGTVRGLSPSGRIRVHFDVVDTVETVPAAALRAVGGGSPADPVAQVSPAAASTRPGAPTPVFDHHRLTVECLRQGLPPPGRFASWTVGNARARKALEKAITGALEGKGSVFLVRAGYGKGKSHFGRLAAELARDQGLLTMEIELDGNGLSLRDGARVVASLFASSRLPDIAGGNGEHLIPGLAPLLRRAAGAVPQRLPEPLEYFEPFLSRAEEWVGSDDGIEALEAYLAGAVNASESASRLSNALGEIVRLPTFRMNWGTTEERRRAQLDQLLRVIELGTFAGSRGALLVIDELDHDLGNDRDQRVSDMLQALADTARENAVVLLLLARDGVAEDPHFEIEGARELELDPLEEDDFAQLVEKAVTAYASAFPHPGLHAGRSELVEKLCERFESEYEPRDWGPRYFVRAAIEACDAVRTRQLRSLAEVDI